VANENIRNRSPRDYIGRRRLGDILLIVEPAAAAGRHVMEASSIVLIMAPILFPVAVKLGLPGDIWAS